MEKQIELNSYPADILNGKTNIQITETKSSFDTILNNRFS